MRLTSEQMQRERATGEMPIAVSLYPNAYLGIKPKWWEWTPIAVTTTPPASFEKMEKFPQPPLLQLP